MAISQMSRIWYTTLTPPQKVVALALADWSDDSGFCYPSLARIAEKVGYSRRQTQRIVSDLTDQGYVSIHEEAKPNRTPTYQLNPEALELSERSEPLRSAPRRGDSLTPQDVETDAESETERGDNMTPQGRQSDTPRGDTGVTPGVTPVSPNTSRDTSEGNPSVDTRDDDELTERIQDRFGLELVEPIDEKPELTVARSPNPYMETMVDIFGEPHAPSGWALYQQLVTKASETGPPSVIQERALALTAQWGLKALTPASLLKWWSRFGSPIGTATDADVEEMREQLERKRREERLAALDDEPTPKVLAPDSDERRESAELIRSLDERYGDDR